MFDFFDYNFSALISIFAALMGMAYPLILQAIQKIDDMYHGTILATFVQQQWPVKLFNDILLVSIPLSIIAPFAIYYCNNNTWCVLIETIHSIVILALLVSAVILFKFIMLTTRPREFRDFIERKCSGSNPSLVELFQIAKFASDTEDETLFNSTVAAIYVKMEEYKKQTKINDENKYPSEVWTFLRELHRQHAKRDNNFFSSHNVLCTLFFTPTEYHPFSNDEYRYLWQSVDAVLHTDNDQWVCSYWTFADQYYRFVMKYNDPSNTDVEDQKRRFRQMHFMLGALLVYNKKFELLNNLMFFSNSTPPEYALVPSSYTQIVNEFLPVINVEFAPLVLTQRYNMIGAPQDVSSDYFIIGQAYKYAALLLIRLFRVNDWNITYSDPMSLPLLDDKLKMEELNRLVNIYNRLKSAIDEWYNNLEALNTAMGDRVPPVEDVKKLCDGYIALCEQKINSIVHTTNVDPQKIQYIKDYLVEAVRSKTLKLPTKTDMAGVNIDSFEGSVLNDALECPLDKEIIKAGTYTNASNLPDLLIERLNELVYRAYNFVFIKHSCNKSVVTPYKDIKHTLDACAVDSSFVVLSMGIYLGNFEELYGKSDDYHFEEEGDNLTYKGCKIFRIPSAMQCLILLKKTDLPFIEISDPTNLKGLEVLDAESHLFSNVDSIKEITEEQQTLLIARGISIKEPNRHIDYLRLKINHHYDSSLDIQSIEESVKGIWG